MRVQNERELGNAVKQEESCIELEGKLASHVKKLMKLNMALWVFSLTTLSVAVQHQFLAWILLSLRFLLLLPGEELVYYKNLGNTA